MTHAIITLVSAKSTPYGNTGFMIDFIAPFPWKIILPKISVVFKKLKPMSYYLESYLKICNSADENVYEIKIKTSSKQLQRLF